MDSPVAGTPGRLDVKTPIFEGPLELLLALAEREEVDIFKVSLAKVTDAYLAEIASREIPDREEMAEFLWMAARLLLLKSIRLLPGEIPTDEETELLGWEDEVRQRLEEYRAYKEMAGELMERAQQCPFLEQQLGDLDRPRFTARLSAVSPRRSLASMAAPQSSSARATSAPARTSAWATSRPPARRSLARQYSGAWPPASTALGSAPRPKSAR